MGNIFRVKWVMRSGEERMMELDVAQRVARRVLARDVQKLEILQAATGFAPDVIKARRVGADLHLDLMEQAESFEHLVLEGYYEEGAAAPIQGLAETEAVLGYMPLSGDPGLRLSALVDGVSAAYALGTGAGLSGGALGGIVASAFPMGGWLPALGGGLALGGLGGGGDGDAASPVPLPLAAASITEVWSGARRLEEGEAAGRLPTLQGTAPAGATRVELYEGDRLVGIASVSDGRWTYTAEQPWAPGVRQLRVLALSDTQEGTWSAPWSMWVADGSTPVVALGDMQDDVGTRQGPLQAFDASDDSRPTLSGTAQPGSWVVVWLNGESVARVLVDANGRWSHELSALPEGEHRVSVSGINAEGEEGPRTGERVFTVDVTPPVGVVFEVVDSVGGQPEVLTQGAGTDEATPTVRGTGAQPGDVVVVRSGDVVLGSALVGADGNWSVTPTVPLAEGPHTLSVVVQDAAGNPSPPSSFALTIDTSGLAVAITQAQDNRDPVQGAVADGGVSNDTTPTLVGTGRPGAVVTISEGNQVLGSVLVAEDGVWRFTPVTEQSEGPHSYSASQPGVNGGAATSTSFALTIDTTAPNAPGVDAINDDVGVLQGPLASGDASDDTTPTFGGTGATPGEIITLYDGDTPIASVVVGPSGAWSVTVPAPGLSEGEHSLTLSRTDAAGNESAPSAPFVLTVDTTAPEAPEQAVGARDDVRTVQDPIPQDGVTDDSRPTFSGVAPEGAQSMRIYDNGVLLGTALVDGEGNWSFTPEVPLADGAHIIRAAPVDAAGNIGGPSPDLVFELRGDAPTVPAITGVSDNEQGITGLLQKEQLTNDPTPTVSGTGVPGSTVVLSANGVEVGSAMVDGDGRWSITPITALPEGLQAFTAVATLGGVSSAPTGEYPVLIDTSAPNAPAAATITDKQGTQATPVTDGQSTDDATPTFSGTAGTPGELITVYANGRPVASALVDGSGNWSATPSEPLREGAQAITVRATDAAGNQSAASEPVGITVDTSAVGVQIYHALDDTPGRTGQVADGGTSNDSTPTLVGRAAPGALVTLSEGANTLGSVVADLGGFWQVDLPSQAPGEHSYTATAQRGGSSHSTRFVLSIDTAAPSAPSNSTAEDDVGALQGLLDSGDASDDATPTFGGSGATPGEIITLYDGDTPIASVVVGPSGVWSLTVPAPGLGEGEHSLTLTTTDAAGNKSEPSPPFVLTVDTSAPSAPTVAAPVIDDVGVFTGVLSAGDPTDDARPALNIGALPAGATPVYLVDGVPVAASYDPSTGRLTPDAAISEGAHTLAYAWRDAAGNTSAPSPATAVVIDTTAPTATATIDAAADDVGVLRDPLASGAVTDDTRPALSGSLSAPLAAGETLRIYDGATFLGNATVNGSAWSFEVPSEVAHSHGDAPSYTARVADAVGNQGVASSPFALTVDTEAPSTATQIVALQDDVGPLTDPVPSGGVTDDTRPRLSGTLDAPLATGETLRVYDGATYLGTATVTGTNWSFAELRTLAHNQTVSYSARVADAAGNLAPLSNIHSATVDIQAPTGVLSNVVVTDNMGGLARALQDGDTTDDATPSISGKAPVGTDWVLVYNGDILVGSAAVDSNGDWHFTPQRPLPADTYAWSAAVADAAGNTGPRTESLGFTVEIVAPVAPAIIAVLDNTEPQPGELQIYASTNDNTPTVQGTGLEGCLVRLYADGVEVGSANVDSNGVWSVSTSALPSGLNRLSARQFSAELPVGPETGVYPIVVDLSAPLEPDYVVMDGVGEDQGELGDGQGQLGRVSDDATPTLSGQGAEPGVVVTVWSGEVELGSALVGADGSWSVTPKQALAEGQHSLKVVAQDAAGNSSEGQPFALTIDTSGLAVAITQAQDNRAPVQGAVADGGVSNDLTPTLVGTGRPGQVVNISEGGQLLGSAEVDANGQWLFELPEASEGQHTYSAAALDSQDALSQSSFSLSIDATAPAAPTFVVQDDVGMVQGLLQSAQESDDTTPTFGGTGASPGEVITLWEEIDGNRVPIASVVVGPSGAWSVTVPAPGLSEGEHSLTLSRTDAAGNESAPSAPFVLTVDTTAPEAPEQAVGARDDVRTVQDPIPQDGVTDDSRPTFSGVAPEGAQSMRIYDNGVLLGTALVDGEGNWSFTPEVPLADGAHIIRAAPVDAAGNIGGPSPDLVFELRGDAPTVPAITGVSDNEQGITGLLQKEQLTNDPTPTVSGTGVPGSTVVLSANGVEVGSAMVDGDGRWSITPITALPEGLQAFTAVATLGGVSSAPTGEYPVLIDTSAPNAPAAATITDKQGTQATPVTDGQSTDDATPTFSGTAGTPGELITVYANGRPVASALVDGSGNWSATPSEPLREGAQAITVRATDAAGNQSAASEPVGITVDTSAVGVQIYHALDDTPGRTGQVADGGTSNDSTPTLVGRAAPGALVTLSEGANTLGSVVADLGGFWQVDLPSQAPGEHSYTATAQRGGSSHSTRFVLSIDTAAPSAPSNSTAEDDVGALQGLLDSGDASDDATPTFGGSGATPGEIITLYDGDTPIASVVVGPSGVWSLTVPAPGLGEGEHSLTLTTTDAAGNKSEPSPPFVLTVDTSAPSAPTVAAPVIDDVGVFTGVLSAGDPTDDARPALNIGALPAGATPVYLVDGVPVAASYDPSTGRLTPDAAISEGAHTLAYAWRDAAGNTSAPSPATAVVIDTTAPTATATIDAAADDVGVLRDPLASGAVTDDTRPALSGSLSAPLAAGETLRIYDGATFLGNATVNGSAWSFEVPSEVAHSHGDAPSYTARVADAVGNQGVASSPFALTVDTEAPSTATQIVALQDDVGPLTDPVPSGGVTDDTRPRLSGTLDAPLATGETLRVYDGATYLGTATVTGTNWSFAELRTLAHNQTVSYSARVADAAGNLAPLSNIHSATVDTQAPATTADVTALLDDEGVFTDPIARGGVTDDTSLVVSGTLTTGLTAGETVRVYDGDTFLGTATVTGTDWTFSDPRTLSHNQTVSYTAQVADAVGNQSAAGLAYAAIVDTQASANTATIATADDDVGIVTDPVNAGGVTDDTRPTLSGNLSAPLSAGETLRIYDDTTFLGNATVNGSNWSFEVPQALAHSHGDTPSYTARVADVAGNLGTVSNTYGITIDTAAPTTATVITAILDNAGIVTDPVVNGGVTDDTSLVLQGTVGQALVSGEVLRIYDGSTYLGNATVTDTDWTFSDLRTLNHDQVVSYTARVGDTSGNQASPSNAYSATIDTQAPATTATITGADDNAAPGAGNVASGGATNDTTPMLSGSLSAPLAAGEIVRVYADGAYLGVAVIAVGATAWTFAVPALAHGDTPSFTVRVTDASGNEGTASAAYSLTVDTQAPTNATTTIAPADVTADNIVNSNEVTSGVTLTGTVTGTFREGDIITLDVNDVLYSTTVAASGAYTVAVDGVDVLADSDRTIDISLQATDAALNVGTVTATKSYLVNAAPVDGDENLSATEGAVFSSFDLLLNSSDADGDARTLSVNSTTGTYASTVTVTNGVLAVNTNDPSLQVLAAGSTSQVLVNYTVSDGRGGSDTSTATITINGANDAPTVSSTAIVNNSALFATSNRDAVATATIDGLNGATGQNTLPVGWTKTGGLDPTINTPDINDAANTAWIETNENAIGYVPGQTNYTYLLTDLDGESLNGGQFVGLVSRKTGTSESMSTTLTGLEVGGAYVVAVQWQQIALRPSLQNQGFYGGQLSITSEGNTGRVYNSSGLSDTWQTAVFNFTATGTSQVINVAINGVLGAATGESLYDGGAIVVDSLPVTAFEQTTYQRSGGVTLDTLFALSNGSDVDAGGFLRGYAITSAEDGPTGVWQYSPDGGANWYGLSAASVNNAFYLASTDRVRFTGLRGDNTQLDLVVVDNTGPALHAANQQATTIDVSTRGGTTPFSQDIVSLSANAAPVLLDLDGDGRISYSTITGDINVDGLADKAHWVAGNDGILFHDKFGDGQLHSMDQYAFAQHGGNTDLEGLAIAFDGNRDGVFDAQDAAFDAFKVWQDLNQDGRVDGGELHSLLSLGITAIALTSDGVERSPVDGVTEHGHSQATLANGGSLLVVDASLDYQHGADLLRLAQVI